VGLIKYLGLQINRINIMVNAIKYFAINHKNFGMTAFNNLSPH